MKLSVIIPAYNEETRIAKTLADVTGYLNQQPYEYEVIVVVNNTKDQTYAIVQEAAAGAMPKVRGMNIPEGGKGNAVKRGIIEAAKGDIMLFMDADNATPISEVAKFLPFFKDGYDVVIGSREVDPELLEVKQTFKRQVLGHLSHWLIRFVLLPGIYDSQTGFKAFSAQAAQAIFPKVTVLGWAFDMEVLAIARANQFQIKEVGVRWSEFGGGHVPMKAFAQSLVDLFRIKLRSLQGKYNS